MESLQDLVHLVLLVLRASPTLGLLANWRATGEMRERGANVITDVEPVGVLALVRILEQ